MARDPGGSRPRRADHHGVPTPQDRALAGHGLDVVSCLHHTGHRDRAGWTTTHGRSLCLRHVYRTVYRPGLDRSRIRKK